MNIWVLIPFAMIPVNSHFVFPAALAVMVWVIYNFQGIKKHGAIGYLKSQCVIPGIPWPMHILLIPMEFLSKILLQPFTLAVRLWANFLAGHFLLAVFFLGTIAMLESGGILYAIAPLSFAIGVALVGFEIFVSLLQAFIFTILTASYIGGAMAEEH